MVSRAIFNESSWCSSHARRSDGIFDHFTLFCGSISPSSKRALSTRLSALSSSSSGMIPFLTASTRAGYEFPHSRSAPLRTDIAEADAGSLGKILWQPSVWKSRTAQQSVTTRPSNPHCSRRILIRSLSLPQQGLPSYALYAHITSCTSVVLISCSNAYRYVSLRSLHERSSTLKMCLSYSGPLWIAKCFRHAWSLSYFSSVSPWRPFTTERPITVIRYGSSP